MKKILGGSILIFLSLFMLLGFFKADTSMSLPVATFTFLIAVILPAIGGGGLYYLHFRDKHIFAKSKETLRLQTQQAEVIKLAERKGGKLTVVEVIGETGMELKTAESVLSSLSVQGIADIEVTDSGMLVYSFPEIQNLAEKESSKGIFDV